MSTVYIYRNLTRGCYSLRDTKTRRVVAHADTAIVGNAVFKVSESGRQRVLRERKKYVHAGVQGELCGMVVSGIPWQRCRYNPYEMDSFCLEDGTPLAGAEAVWLTPEGMLVFNPQRKENA